MAESANYFFGWNKFWFRKFNELSIDPLKRLKPPSIKYYRIWQPNTVVPERVRMPLPIQEPTAATTRPIKMINYSGVRHAIHFATGDSKHPCSACLGQSWWRHKRVQLSQKNSFAIRELRIARHLWCVYASQYKPDDDSAKSFTFVRDRRLRCRFNLGLTVS